jgi:hypothetical protein
MLSSVRRAASGCWSHSTERGEPFGNVFLARTLLADEGGDRRTEHDALGVVGGAPRIVFGDVGQEFQAAGQRGGCDPKRAGAAVLIERSHRHVALRGRVAEQRVDEDLELVAVGL